VAAEESQVAVVHTGGDSLLEEKKPTLGPLY
jgi:hypothetical protein